MNSISYLRLHASIYYKTKTIHRISSRNSILSVSTKIFLQSSLWSSSKKVFFIGGISHLPTDVSVKSVTLSQNLPCMYDMPDFSYSGFSYFFTDHNISYHFILW